MARKGALKNRRKNYEEIKKNRVIAFGIAVLLGHDKLFAGNNGVCGFSGDYRKRKL